MWTPISIDDATAWSSTTPNARGTTYPTTRLIAQKSPATTPTSAKESPTLSRSEARMPRTSTARITAEPIRTGRSIDRANPGRRARTSIPMPTGTRISRNTLTTSDSGIETESPWSK